MMAACRPTKSRLTVAVLHHYFLLPWLTLGIKLHFVKSETCSITSATRTRTSSYPYEY